MKTKNKRSQNKRKKKPKRRWKPSSANLKWHAQCAILLRMTIDEKDRSLVIDVMSEIHIMLKRLAINRLGPDLFAKKGQPLEKDSLVGNNKPCGSFENTLLLASRLKKIPKLEVVDIYRDLQLLNRIRNKFAHRTKYSFSHEDIKNHMEELEALSFLRRLTKKDVKKTHICLRDGIKRHGLSKGRLDFLWCASFITFVIDHHNNTILGYTQNAWKQLWEPSKSKGKNKKAIRKQSKPAAGPKSRE